MTLEADVAALTVAVNALTAEVTNKIAAIDAAVTAKEAEVDAFLVGAKISTNSYAVSNGAALKLLDATGNPLNFVSQGAIIIAKTGGTDAPDVLQIAWASGNSAGTGIEIGFLKDNANLSNSPRIFIDGDGDLAVETWNSIVYAVKVTIIRA